MLHTPRIFVPPRDFVPPAGLIAGEIVSRRQPQNEVQRGTIVTGRDESGHVRWSGRFRNRADAEQFVISSITGELWFDSALWDLPSPGWHPDYGPLIYDFAISIDGHVNGAWASGTSFTVTGLTTTNAGDVIAAFITTVSNSLVTVSSLSTSGVVWQGTARKTTTYASAKNGTELWYGTATATLSSVTTTINLSGAPSSAAIAEVFGISGSSTSSFNDSNASLPAATNTGSSGVAPSVSAVSTSNASDMIIGGAGTNSATTQTAGSGFTLIDTASSGNKASIAAQQEVVNATQSSITVAFGTNSGATWSMIVDALKAVSFTGSHNQRIFRTMQAYRWLRTKPRFRQNV